MKFNIKIPNVTKTSTFEATIPPAIANPVFRLFENANQTGGSVRGLTFLNETIREYQAEPCSVIDATAFDSTSEGGLHANADLATTMSFYFDTTCKQFGYIQ